MSDRHEMEIKDAIRTLAKEFYRNPSAFTSRADFKERFYEICLGKRALKKKYKLLPLTGEKLSVVKKDCPIYFAEKEGDKILEWSYDIAVLSPDLITRFMFDNPWHMSLLKNDAVGLIAAIEFLFIPEHSNTVQMEVESCYAKMDLAHHLALKYIVAFSNSHEGNDWYFERTINDPGSPLEPDIICISVQQDESGKRSIQYEQHPLPWITTSKFKDRMERLDYYLSWKLWWKLGDWKESRFEKRYMPQVSDAISGNRVVAITGHAAVDRMAFGFSIQRYFSHDSIFGNRVTLVNFSCCEHDFVGCLESIASAFRIPRRRRLSLEAREKFDEEFYSKIRRMSLQEKEQLLRESIPEEKGLIIFHDVSNDALIRKALGYMGHWHAVVISRKPVARNLVDVSIDIAGRQKKPGFIAKYLCKYLFGESKW